MSCELRGDTSTLLIPECYGAVWDQATSTASDTPLWREALILSFS